jgi:cellulose synthase/poly-beta-1,6-N-acetylglucosamine synthase-like glycosyltransferase
LDKKDETTMRKKESVSDGSMKEIDEEEWVFVKKLSEAIPIVKDDFYSKDLKGFVQRNIHELGGDKTLALKLIEKGFQTRYEPNAVAFTEGPDTIAGLMQQRRRRSNAEFWNNFLMFFNWRIWIKIRTIPLQFLALFHVVYTYILPVNSIIVTLVIWDNFIRWVNENVYIELSTDQIIFWWVAIQVVVMVSTKLATSDMFYALITFFTGAMMIASGYFFVNYVCIPIGEEFVLKPASNWGSFVLLIIFGVQHLVLSLFNPLVFIAGAATYIFFPTFTFTFQVYSFLNQDDFTWGNR